MRLCLRKIGVCLMVCLLLLVSVIPVYAATGDGNVISPMALYYRNATADLSISSSGTATVEGSVVGIVGTTTKTSVYVYLQRYEGGTWVDVYDWSEMNNSVSTTVSKTQNVTKGPET